MTSIAANHGRAIEGAADFLSTESRVQALLTTLVCDKPGSLPPRFQLLLRVDMIDFDDEVVEVALETARMG